jgi:hypothetical protein
MPTLVAPPPADAASIAKAREAMEQKMKDMGPEPAVGTAAAAPSAQPFQRKPASAKSASAFPPLQGPSPAISAEKEQRLQELLRKYQADQISPEEYHQQRAKILGGP